MMSFTLTAPAAGSLARHRLSIVGIFLMLLALMPMILGLLFMDPALGDIMGDMPNLLPSWQHPLGTQSEGRDILVLLAHGTPSTLIIGLIGGTVALLLGTALGFVSGYFGGAIDAVIKTGVDVGLASTNFPMN